MRRRLVRRPKPRTTWYGSTFQLAYTSGASPNGAAAQTTILSQATIRTWVGQSPTVVRIVGSWYANYTKSDNQDPDEIDTLAGIALCHPGETVDPRTQLEQENYLWTDLIESGGDVVTFPVNIGGVPVLSPNQIHTKERQRWFDIGARRKLEEPAELCFAANTAHYINEVEVVVRGYFRALLQLK